MFVCVINFEQAKQETHTRTNMMQKRRSVRFADTSEVIAAEDSHSLADAASVSAATRTVATAAATTTTVTATGYSSNGSNSDGMHQASRFPYRSGWNSSETFVLSEPYMANENLDLAAQSAPLRSLDDIITEALKICEDSVSNSDSRSVSEFGDDREFSLPIPSVHRESRGSSYLDTGYMNCLTTEGQDTEESRVSRF